MAKGRVQFLNEPFMEDENAILSYVDSLENASDIQFAIEKLANFRQETIVKFARKRSSFKQFCESHPELHENWRNILINHHSPYQTLETSSENPSIMDHLIGDVLIDIFSAIRPSDGLEQERVLLLDEACRLGVYKALLLRGKFTLQKLKHPNLTREQFNVLVEKVMIDNDRLSHLYGEIGYVRAGIHLQEIANIFFKKQNETYKQLGCTYFEAAIKNYLCGYLLKDNAKSKAILTSITHQEGLTSLFVNNSSAANDEIFFAFSDWDNALPMFENWVGSETYRRLFHEASVNSLPAA